MGYDRYDRCDGGMGATMEAGGIDRLMGDTSYGSKFLTNDIEYPVLTWQATHTGCALDWTRSA